MRKKEGYYMMMCENTLKVKQLNKLYYSPEAMSDLDEIWNYLSEDLQKKRFQRLMFY